MIRPATKYLDHDISDPYRLFGVCLLTPVPSPLT